MPYISNQDKDTARRMQRRCENSKACATFAGAAVAAVFKLLGTDIWVNVAEVAGLIVAASEWEARRQGQLAEDPPDPDYRRRPRRFMHPFNSEGLIETELGRMRRLADARPSVDDRGLGVLMRGVTVAKLSFDAGSSLRAFVLSVERAWGARLDGAVSFERARLADAKSYAAQSATGLRSTSEMAEVLGLELDQLQDEIPPYEEWRPLVTVGSALWETLPAEALAGLYTSKIRVQELDAEVRETAPEPLTALSAALRAAAATRRELADSLDAWNAPDARA